MGSLEVLSRLKLKLHNERFQMARQVGPHYLMGTVPKRGPVPVLRVKSMTSWLASVSAPVRTRWSRWKDRDC